MEEKKDWFSLYYQNQDAKYSDYLNNGITSNDVQLRDKEFYKTNDRIVQAFTDETGKFNEQLFDNFYTSALLSFNNFSTGDFIDNEIPYIADDIMSGIALPGEKLQDINISINKERNPFIKSKGINSVLGYTETDQTEYELAQSNRIWDTENNRWLDSTPEDLGFWGTLTDKPIIFARYDEDTEVVDPETGRIVKHLKGEMKLDENGRPYYETLGNRDAANREFLSPFNVITREGSGWNKIDFLDNDGKDKSMIGTIAQTAATIAPMLIPYVGKVYTGLIAAKNLALLGITLSKMYDGVVNPDKKTYDYGLMNTIQAKLTSLTPGVSKASQESMVTFENFGNLISDVVSQLYQQRLIAELPRYLGVTTPEKAMYKAVQSQFGDDIAQQIYQTGKITDQSKLATILRSFPEIQAAGKAAAKRHSILGKWGSSFYMSGISTMDVYQDALDAGYDKDWAAFTTALAMGATTWLVGSTEIGQWALKGMGFEPERKLLRDAGRKLIDLVKEEVPDLSWKTVKDPKVFNRILRKSGQLYRGAANLINTGGLFGAGLAEGIEEISEEAIMDFSKEFTDGLTAVFGVQPEANFKFLESNPMERYLMAGVGGAVGGAIFKIANRQSDINSKLPTDTKELIFQYLRSGKKEELKRQLEKLGKRGVAPKNLSALNTEVINGETKYLPLEQDGTSLNDAVIGLANNLIDEWDIIINQEGMALDNDQLISRISLQDKRIQDLLKFDGVTQLAKDYNSIGAQIVELTKRNSELSEQISPGSGMERINVEEAQIELQQNQAKLNELKQQKDLILNGSKTKEYVARSLFALSSIKDPILATDIITYAKYALNKDYNSLSEAEQNDVKERYNKYREKGFEAKFNDAYNIFTELTKKYGQDLFKLAQQLPLLDATKKYLDGAEESQLLTLNEEYLRNFDIERKLNSNTTEVATNRGLDYIFNTSALVFSSPEVKNLINSVISNIRYKLNDVDIPIGVDVTSTLNTNTFEEWMQRFFTDFGSKIVDENPDGSTSEFKRFKDNLNQEIRDNANNPESTISSSDLIRQKWLEYSNKISSPEYKQIFLNLINSAYSDDPIKYSNDLQKGINSIIDTINYILIPSLRLSTAKQLIADTKVNGQDITKDVYNQVLNYIKPDSEFELNKSNLENYIFTSFGSQGHLEDLISDSTPEDVKDLIAGDMNFDDLEKAANTLIKASQQNNWWEVIRTLRDSGLSNADKESVLYLLNQYNKSGSKIDFSTLSQLEDFLIDPEKVKDNPLTDLLQKIEIEVLGNQKNNIYSLLASENSLLKSTTNLSEFVIQGKVTSDEINAAMQTIDMLQSIVASTIQSTDINGSGYGFNTTLNAFTEENQLEGTTQQDLLPEIDQVTANKILFELNRIKGQLNFFLELSERNVGNKLREHRVTSIQARKAFLNLYRDRNFISKCPDLFNGVQEIIDQYDLNSFDDTNLSDEDYFKLEELLNRVEDKVYDNAKALEDSNTYTRVQLINSLFSGLDYSKLVTSEYYISDGFNSKTEEILPSDQFVYFHTILSLKSSEWNKALKDTIDEESRNTESKFLIPLFAQEYNARINAAMAINPVLMNDIVNITEDRINSIKDPKWKEVYSKYIKQYENLVFNNGASGTGKTNGVGRLTNKIINRLLGNQNIVLVGPKSQQAINLTNAILETNYSDSTDINSIESEIKNRGHHVLTKEQLLNTIYKDPSILISANRDFQALKDAGSGKSTINSEFIDHINIPEQRYQTYSLKSKYLEADNFKTDAFTDQKIIYIDEVTHFSKFELEALTTWAKLNNKILITFGDLIQSGYSNINDGTYLGIDLDATKISTPSLEISLRVTNIHKKDNSDVLRTLVREIYKDPYRYNNFESIPAFKYYEDNEKLHGEKITSAITFNDLDKLNNSSIILIYDDPNSATYKLVQEYNNSHDKKIPVFRTNEVQGLEADYAICDLHSNFREPNLRLRSFRDLYTAITRSKSGTIIINNGITTLLKPSEQISYTQDSIINSEAAKSFADLRLKSLNYLLRDYQPSKVETTETSSSTQVPVTKPKDTSLEQIFGDVFNEDEAKAQQAEEDLYKEKPTKYPDDSIMCYSFAGRIRPWKGTDSSGKEYISLTQSITHSGLYNSDHTCFFNNKYTGLNPTEFWKVFDVLKDVKGVLYGYTDPKTRKRELSKYQSRITDIFQETSGNTGSLDLVNGKFQLKAIKYSNNGEVNKSNNRSEDLRLVYNIPIIDSSTDQQFVELYIYSFPDISKSSYKTQKWYPKFSQFYTQQMSKVTDDISKQYTAVYTDLPNLTLERISNSVIWKKEDRKHINYEDAKIAFPNMYFSAPYVVANYDRDSATRNATLQKSSDLIDRLQNEIDQLTFRLNNETDQNKITQIKQEITNRMYQISEATPKHTLRGKAVVFATYSRDLYDENGLVPPERYDEYYIRQLKGEFDDKPDMRDKVKMIVLSPNALQFRDFFKKYQSYVTDKSKYELGSKYYKTYFGDYIGYDILVSLYNYKIALEREGKQDHPHYKIATRLYDALFNLSRVDNNDNVVNTDEDKSMHIMRILQRLHLKMSPELYQNNIQNINSINGHDVLHYLRLFIEAQENDSAYRDNFIENLHTKVWFPKFDPSIKSTDIIACLEMALHGHTKDVNGKEHTIPNYNPLFKEGIYLFPVLAKNDDKLVQMAGKEFIKSVTLEGSYYIDRDIQPPRFAFVISRDFNTSSAPRTNPNPPVRSTNEDLTRLKTTFNSQVDTLLSSIVDPKIRNLVSNKAKDILSIVDDSFYKTANLTEFIKSVVNNVNQDLQNNPIEYDSTNNLSSISYNNTGFTFDLTQKNNPDLNENLRNLKENRLYLQNNGLNILNDNIQDINSEDIQKLVDYLNIIETASPKGLQPIVELINNNVLTSDLVNLILNNMNVADAVREINKIRSKHNIC